MLVACVPGNLLGGALVQREWLEELNAGLLLISGAQAGPVGQALLQGDTERAADLALQLASLFTHRFYIELQRAGRPDDERHVVAAVQLAARLHLPVVATHPVQFLETDDYEAHEARVCISDGEILGNNRRVRRFTREQIAGHGMRLHSRAGSREGIAALGHHTRDGTGQHIAHAGRGHARIAC